MKYNVIPSVAVVILDVKYSGLKSFARQLHRIFSQSEIVICISVNEALIAEQVILINTRAKLNEKIVFIQYEFEPSHHIYVDTIARIMSDETVFPVNFDSLVLGVNMCNQVQFTHIKDFSEFERFSPHESKECESVIGLLRAPSDYSVNSFIKIKNELIRVTGCTSYCLLDYLVDESGSEFQLDVLAFEPSKEHSWSNTIFINDYLGWSNFSTNDLVNGAENLLKQVGS
jgi:hypothetical protein